MATTVHADEPGATPPEREQRIVHRTRGAGDAPVRIGLERQVTA
ncbi:MAG TPA: hypothetical protein VF178_02800 [Gemmatimonadaceae bacterium]